MRSLSFSVVVCLVWVGLATSGAVAQPRSPRTVVLVPATTVTTWPDASFRWRDIATNAYAPSYQDVYTYDDATVSLTFEQLAEFTFAGHLSATNLKPNFAYQMKLVGKPTGLWGADGDDAANERIGYAGRWWRRQPNPGNADDADYQAHHDDPAYIYEGYLLFDFFLTDRFGAAEADFSSESSDHVLWWQHQRIPQTCDSPIQWRTVTGAAEDPAYAVDLVPTDIGVYAEIERLCFGETTLPVGTYNCRFVLTEESFHQSGGPSNPGWVSVSGNQFWMDGGPFHYAGTNCYYLMQYAANPADRPYVDEVLEETRAMGLSVVRTWAFSDGGADALQTEPGVYNESVFQGLDYVLDKAHQLGLHLILPLVNNWDDYGGMNQYVAWSDGNPPPIDAFVTRNGTHFQLDGSFYYFAGANFWYGLNLGSLGPGGDRDRLDRELDGLISLGVNSLVVMAGTEGPDTEPWRMVPSLQTAPGVYDPQVLDGLDYLLKAMKDRGLRAVMVLSNFWPWSGGLAQYVRWNGGDPIPYPPPEPGGDWNEYAYYTVTFYSNPGAMQDYQDHVNFLVNRVNPYTGLAYKNDWTIMAWQLANEPRGYNNAAAFNQWIDDTAAYIKSLDSNHLVTTGCEGDTPWPSWNGLDFIANNDGPNIDYTTIHIYPQNWLWYDSTNPTGTYATAEANARAYFNTHESKAVTLNKPMVLEEFGLPRDGGSYDPASGTTWRDQFFTAMYDEVHTSASSGGPAAGDNFWCWAGEGRPLVPYGSYWSPGDPWIGDPPHEPQGWYSVYDSDSGTLAEIASHAADMMALMGGAQHDDFYTNANCRQFYKNHVSAVLNRTNTFNGRVYKQDPTILAWELANEPRCTSDASGNRLQDWIEEMAAYIKSQDGQHLATTGSEGFYGPTGPAHNPKSWFGSQGVDFTRNHQPANVDFACFHAWPDSWVLTYAQSMTWAEDHVEDAQSLLGKPVILEEFGKARPLATRDQFYQGWFDAMYAKAAAGKAAGGLNFWILYHDAYPDYDGFGVYYPADATTVNIISTQARKMRDLSQPIPYEGQWASAVLCDTIHFEITGESQGLAVTDVYIDNTTLIHTDDYIKNSDGAVVTATVTGTGIGTDDISADLSGLGGGASVVPESYVSEVATWTITHVTCTPSNGTVTVTVTATDGALKGTASDSDDITADNTPPAAITGFRASPHHQIVSLTWDNPSGLDAHFYGVLVRYDGAGTYPEYGALGTYPSGPTAGGGTAFDGTGAVTSADHTIAARDIYYYTAFAYDQAMNYGPAATSAQARATNYRLGDVSADMSPGGGDYDGLVDEKDINSLSAAYWLPTLPPPHNECDVGPTDDGRGSGIPEPDDHVDFEDLMIFSLTYGLTGKESGQTIWLAGPARPGPATLRLESRRGSSMESGQWVSLVLDGDRDEIKGASIVLTYDPGALRLEDISLAPPLRSAGGQVFFWWQETPPGSVRLDLGVLGPGAALAGSGELARLRFQSGVDEDTGISITRARLRDAANADLPVSTEDLCFGREGSSPPATRLVGAWPNPYRPSTVVSYDLSRPGHVTLRVYDTRGRLVADLVDQDVGTGRHRIPWNGRDDSGCELTSGVYLIRMRAGTYESTTKVVVLR